MDKKPRDKESEQKNNNLKKLIQTLKENEVTLLKEIHELKLTQKHYDILMQNTEDYILICDGNGIPQAFNESYKRRGKELLNIEMKPGLQPHKLASDPEIAKYWDSLQSRALKGEKFSAEYSDKKRQLYFETIFCPVKEGQKTIGFTEITRDITERKQAEKGLRESNEFSSSLLEYSPTAILVINPDTSIKYVNPLFEKLTGYTSEDVLGIKFPYPWMIDDTKYGDIEKRKKEGVHQSERQYKKKNGDCSWVEIDVTPIYHNGEISYSLATWVDIVERKNSELEKEKLQKQLQQAQRMEAIGNLAGGVAHDYNNISSIIMGYAELALDRVESGNPLYADITEILTAVKRSTDITKQLLAFARRQPIAPKILDLNNTIENMIKMIKRLIGEDIDLAWLPGEGVWPVKIDPSQIDQIIVNLCINARDAIENVGKVTIETKNVIFNEDYCADHLGFKPGEYAMLAVSDDGKGMTLEQQGKVFDPFFTTKGLGKGTGLGLSTVYGIAKQNNGFINVYSEPDKGTTFKIYLRKEDTSHIKSYHEKTLDYSLSKGETIMIVEDDISILKLGERILKNLKYTVLCASTPKEAITLIREYSGKIDLLITDIILPEVNGRELAEELQKQYNDLKVLFMSGYTANVIIHRGVLDEGINFIAKPFSKNELASKVKEVLESD